MYRSQFHRLASRVSLPMVISLAGLVAGCSESQTPSEEIIRPVRTVVVSSGEDTHQRTFPGRVDASRRVELAFQVPGLLAKLPIKEGQEVAQGDVIGQLRQDEFEARLKSMQSQLDEARANLQALRSGDRPEERLRREAEVRAAEARLTNARADLDRAERLLPTRSISQAEYEQFQTAYRVAQEDLKAVRQQLEAGLIGRKEDIAASEAQVRGLEARVVEANLQLQDSTLKAPFDGVIAQRFVEEGQNVQAKQPIVRFQDVDQIEIVVDVPEVVMAAEISSADILEMYAELSTAPGLRFPVQINEISQVADPTTQTFTVRVVMQAPEGIRLLPGMTATVTVAYRRANILGDRIMVPVTAVFQRPDGDQVVWIIGKDGLSSPRPVTTGPASGSQIEIVEGVQPGDRVAIAGVSFLRDGMKVSDLGDGLGGEYR